MVAPRASQFDGSNIASGGRRGSFSKKPGDAKHSLNAGLYAAYLLTGDDRPLDHVRAVAELVASVPTRMPAYSQTSGLWTERHLGAALAGALYAYEVTGDAMFKTRMSQIVGGMQSDVNSPPASYPGASQMAGVLLNRPEVHMGGSYPDLIMSPWMSAPMMESMWHYDLLSDDCVGLGFLSNGAEFVEQRAVTQDGSTWSPWHLAGPSGNYCSAGAGHVHDVMGLLARGRWARQRLCLPTTPIDTQLGWLQATADGHLTRSGRAAAPVCRDTALRRRARPAGGTARPVTWPGTASTEGRFAHRYRSLLRCADVTNAKGPPVRPLRFAEQGHGTTRSVTVTGSCPRYRGGAVPRYRGDR